MKIVLFCNCEACKKYSKTRLVEKWAKKNKIKIKNIKISKVKVKDFLGLPKLKRCN